MHKDTREHLQKHYEGAAKCHIKLAECYKAHADHCEEHGDEEVAKLHRETAKAHLAAATHHVDMGKALEDRDDLPTVETESRTNYRSFQSALGITNASAIAGDAPKGGSLAARGLKVVLRPGVTFEAENDDEFTSEMLRKAVGDDVLKAADE